MSYKFEAANLNKKNSKQKCYGTDNFWDGF